MKINEDSELQNFLRQNKPVVPLSSNDFEKNLFHLIENEPQFKRAKISPKIIFPTGIAASLLLVFGGYSGFNPTPKIATNDTEIEKFLVNSWNSTIEGHYINHTTTPEGEWLMLTNYESK